MSEGGVRTRTRAEVSRRGSSASARTGAPARDAVAFSRALALRLVFDTGAVAVLDGYRPAAGLVAALGALQIWLVGAFVGWSEASPPPAGVVAAPSLPS